MRSTRVLALTVLALLGGPATAGAATTYGTTTGTSAGAVPTNATIVQLSAGQLAAGVITSWSVNVAGSPATPSTITFKVMRPVSGTPNAYTVVSTATGAVPGSSASVLTFATRLAAAAGDFIAVYVPAGVTVNGAAMGSASYATGDFPPGAQMGPSGITTAPATAFFSARLEADADGDGYGDESQDSCPALAAVHTGGCAADVSVGALSGPSTLGVGDVGTFTARISNSPGSATAMGATSGVAVPDGLALVALYGPGADCITAPPLSCPLGDIPAGESRRVVLQVKATTPGVRGLRVTGRSDLPDPDPTNNATDLAVTVPALPMPVPAVPAPSLPSTPMSRPAGIKLCTVPKLARATRSAATAKLKSAGCALGKVIAPKGKGKAPRVSLQTIPAGTRVLAGTKVGLTLRRKR